MITRFTFTRVALAALLVTLWLGLLGLAAPAPAQSLAPTSQALGTTWTGYADTNLRFTEFFAASHTVALRFMAQFPNTYEGPFVAENGSGRFMLGQGDFLRSGQGTKLLVTVGSQSRTYAVNLQAGRWYHLALVNTASSGQHSFQLYLNGTPLGTPLTVSSSDSSLPNGTLRFGKRTTGQTVNGHDAQTYGLLDDIAVFNRALTPAEVQNLSSNVLQLTGSESGLLAGYTFNQGSLPAKLSRPVSLFGASQRVPVSTSRNSAADAGALLLPTKQAEMTLPFPPGEAWRVVQGFDSAGGSHKGYASFCWDFSIAGYPQSGAYPNGSKNAPFYSAGTGTVIVQDDSGVSGPANPANLIQVQQAPGEIASYLHLAQNSALVDVGNPVVRRQKLALTGDTGVAINGHHLHFGAANLPRGTAGRLTFPVAFTNYEVRDEDGEWHRVYRGIPKTGEVIRVPADPAVRYNAVWHASTTPEQQVEGYSLDDYRAVYNTLFSQGWRLHSLQSYVDNGEVRYNAVWHPGSFAEIPLYGAYYTTFRQTYDLLFPAGWRLYLLQSYVLNGEVRYNAVFRPGSGAELQAYGWTYTQYRQMYDRIFPQGYRLQILQSYVHDGQVRYNAVWRPGSFGEIQLYGASYTALRERYDAIYPQGWRLQILQAYVLNGQARYNAVWRPGTFGEIQLYSGTYLGYRRTYDHLYGLGWRLFLLDAYKP